MPKAQDSFTELAGPIILHEMRALYVNIYGFVCISQDQVERRRRYYYLLMLLAVAELAPNQFRINPA
jgi:hypothetical protein